MALGDDPVVWGEEHKYSFESGYTPMGNSGGIGEPGDQYRDRNANLWVDPQEGLKGTAHTTALIWSAEGGNTPGGIITGSTVDVNIQ